MGPGGVSRFGDGDRGFEVAAVLRGHRVIYGALDAGRRSYDCKCVVGSFSQSA
jgi:hypothetical protein